MKPSQELVEMAIQYWNIKGYLDPGDYHILAKFGEQVARDCAKIAQQYDVRGGSSDVMYGQADAAGRIAEAILRKFGLEPKENL
jgi:hypothetical protein